MKSSKRTLAQKTNLDQLVVTAGCRIQVVNEETWKYETIAETVYTPYAINQVLKKHKLQSAWVNLFGNRELWMVSKGRLANHA